MKSTMKKLIAVMLVLVLTLSLFAGCNESSVKTSDEYLLSEYGMTFAGSTVTYDGSAQSIKISATSTSGYSVSYSYLSGSTEVSTSGVTDAGTYEVIATITESDGEVYYLSEDLTINPATLSISVPDQYVRKGSDADDIDDVFEDLELLGSDTIKSIGMEWDLADIDDIAAMTDVSEGKALGVTITSENYTLSVSKGTLYVLSYADYTAVTTLKLDVTNLESYGDRFDELTYTENSAYISAAGRVLDVFDNEDDYTSIQVAMLGSVSQSEISSNLATAQARKIQGYSLDWDVAGDIPSSKLSVDDDDVFGAVYVVAGYDGDFDEVIRDNNADDEDNSNDSSEYWTLTKNAQMWVEDDDDDLTAENRFYIDNGFFIDYDGRDDEDTYDDYEDQVMYGDYFYFVLAYYDNASYDNDYVIEELLVRNKGVSYEDDAYTVYKQNNSYSTTQPSSGSYETFMVYKLRADSTTIGALGEGTSIDVTVEDLAKYNIEYDEADESNSVVSSLTITGKSSGTAFSYDDFQDWDDYTDSTNKNVADQDYFEDEDSNVGYFVVGEEYDLVIYMLDGYYISEVMIGDYSIDGSQLDNGKYTFTVEEDMFDVDAGDYAEIVVYTGKSYDISMKINSRTVRSTTGEYEADAGTVNIDGYYVSGSTVYTIEGNSLDFTFAPADNYKVSSVIMWVDDVTSDDDFTYDSGSSGSGWIELIDEVSSNKLSIDISDDCDYFDFEDISDASSVQFQVTFAESWNIEVESDDVVFKQNAAGEFVSDYGTISVLDYDEDILTQLSSGDYYMIYAELEPGYIISSLKIHTSSKTIPSYTNSDQTGSPTYTILSDYAYDSIDDGEMYFFSDYENYTSSPSFKSGSIEEDDLYQASFSLDGGETITIEVEFDTYYELSIDNDATKVSAGFSTASSDNTYFYQMSAKDDTIIIFGSHDSKTATLVATFNGDWWAYYCREHTGLSSSYVSAASNGNGAYNITVDTGSITSSDVDADIDDLEYFFEVEGDIIEDFSFSGSKFKYTADYSAYNGKNYEKEVSIGFDDLMDSVSPGDEIVIIFYEEVTYD